MIYLDYCMPLGVSKSVFVVKLLNVSFEFFLKLSKYFNINSFKNQSTQKLAIFVLNNYCNICYIYLQKNIPRQLILILK